MLKQFKSLGMRSQIIIFLTLVSIICDGTYNHSKSYLEISFPL